MHRREVRELCERRQSMMVTINMKDEGLKIRRLTYCGQKFHYVSLIGVAIFAFAIAYYHIGLNNCFFLGNIFACRQNVTQMELEANVSRHLTSTTNDSERYFMPMLETQTNDSWEMDDASESSLLIDGKNRTIEYDDAFEFGFRLPCSLDDSVEVMSALRRMTTMKCRQEAAALACLDRKGQLYPERLPRFCPTQGREKGEYLGCYLDNFENRLLGNQQFFLSDNTPQRCLDQCLQLGFSLSGVQYGEECFCGFDNLNSTFLQSEAACSMTCSGDGKQTCGGSLAMNVYHTGISILYPPQVGHASSQLSGPGVKVLYLFTVSGRSVRQLKRLFKALYHSTQTYFFIHVDAREDYMFRELLPLEARFPNVRFSRSRRSPIWGGTTLLDVLLGCMEEVLAMADWQWDYLLNLSESDFPVKTHKKLITFLTANNGTNFINHLGTEIYRYMDVQGLRHTFHECENRMWNIGVRKLPFGIQFDGGSDWLTLSRSFVHFIVHDANDLVIGLKKVYKHTLYGAETFFHTLILNSEFCPTLDNNNLRLINWRRPAWNICDCFTRGVIDWCGCSPYAFKSENWADIRATIPADVFLARKFQPLINQAIINYVEAWLYGTQPDGLPGYTSYWENEFHSDDVSPPVDSAFYTVYQSLSRLSVKLMKSTMADKCNLTVNHILEATLFNDGDVFKGTLVMFEVSNGDETVILETRAMPIHFYEVFDENPPLGRLKSMEVGTHYNDMDKVFRNLGRIFGVQSKLCFQHKWTDGEPINATFVWADPTNTVAASMDVAIPAEVYTGFYELNAAHPLRPGAWTVKLVHNSKNIAETTFLVVPLSHKGTSPITAQEAEFLNSGLPDKISYLDANFSSIEKILIFDKEDDASSFRLSEARRNGKLFGAELLHWIDGLVTKFYDIQDICHVTTPLSSNSSCIFDSSSPCRLVSWSSRYTDPKSDVSNVNKFSGLIESDELSEGKHEEEADWVIMPVAVRANLDRGRVCRKYGPFVFVAATILACQLILAYGIYRINAGSDDVEDPTSGGSSSGGTGRLVKSRQRSQYEEDDYRSDDERGQLSINDYHQNGAHHGRVGKMDVIISTNKLEVSNLERHHEGLRVTLEDIDAKDILGIRASVVLNATTMTTTTTSTAKKDAAIPLDLSELSFVPDCAITTKEAVSAIRRAKTETCKRELANLTCLYQVGKLYPQRLPRYCPSRGRKMGEHLGCYQDDKKQRLFIGHMFTQSNNTPQRCVDMCLQSGFPLAGLQYGMECFCGDTYPSAKLLLSETDCDIPCSGDETKSCGGYFKMNVYHTGLSRTSPKPQPPVSKLESNSHEPNARILYLLTLNGRAVRQVRRLIKALYHVQSYFFIHVDARQDYLFRELLPLEAQFSNIRLSRWRLSTIWGGASLLQMMLHCMKEVLFMDDWQDWDFFINLSESDFPIKTHKELITFLTENKGKNFLKSHGKDTQRFITRQGLDKTFHECDTHMWRIGNRQLPMGIRVDGGSDWVAISQDFVRYVVHNTSELVVGLKTVFQQSLLPAESFFHMLLQNSEFCVTFVDNNLHVTNWKRKVGCRCQYKHVVDWCGCSPNVFKPDDWKRIRTADSRPFYFARKFEPIINQAVIDQLETWLYSPPPEDMPGRTSYWQNEYHFNDTSPAVDNSFYAAYSSFCRLSVNLLEDLSKTCMLVPSNILEATLYNDNDLYKGTLILFEAVSGAPHDETVLLETQVIPRQFYDVYTLVGPTKRLQYLQVGTNYDQKEQLFRNLGQLIGPNSEPCLLHKWGEGEAFTATFVWVDPVNTVAGSFEVKVDAGTNANFHKPSFLQPLLPGKWTVKLMHEWKTVAETKFLVIPLSHNGTKEIDAEHAKLLNGGSGKRKYVEHNFTSIERLLGFRDDESKLLMENSRLKGELNGKNRLDWIDLLVSQFYSVQDTCYLQTVSKTSPGPACPSVMLDACQTVPWSSRYPDPKSVIGKVIKATGRLQR